MRILWLHLGAVIHAYILMHTYIYAMYKLQCILPARLYYNTQYSINAEWEWNRWLSKSFNFAEKKNNSKITLETDCSIIRNMPLSAIYFIVSFFFFICRYIYLTHQESGSPIGANKFFCFNCKSNIYMNTQAAEQA